MNSTELHPLAYFEYIVNKDNISEVIRKHFYYSDCVSIGLGDLIEIKYVEQNDFGGHIAKSITTKDLLLPILYREFQKAKVNLHSFCIGNEKLASENYLRIQINTLQALINNNSNLINNHSYFMLPIRGFLNYINDILLTREMERFELDESRISTTSLSDTEQISFDLSTKSDIEIIHSIFDYMSGLNEKREKILSDEDFELLVKYTTELIEHEKLPVVEKQLEPKISSDLLRFSFWVLHKELYNTQKIRSYFYDFIYAVFLNFKNNDISSIKSQFGTKKRVPPHKFIPEIITNHL